MLNEQLQKQINDETVAGMHTHPGTDYGNGFNKGYDSGYKIAADKYAALWQAAEAKAERAEKALREIHDLIERAEDESIFVNEIAIRQILANHPHSKTRKR